MGKYKTPPAGCKLYRSLKVTLRSRGDRDYVLKSAMVILTSTEKNLLGIYITKLFTSDEMRTIKKLRLQCHDMNAAESAKYPDGHDRFVVIDKKIMKRQDNGTLGPCMQPVVVCKPPKGSGRPTTERDGGNKSTVQLTKDSVPATQQEASNKSPGSKQLHLHRCSK